MRNKLKIPVEKLKNKLDLSKYKFKTTEELESDIDIIGQKRGVKSLNFGLSIKRKGYNIYTSGECGTGRTSHAYQLASEYSKKQEVPDDLCYVYNFKENEKTTILKLKAGEGKILKNEIEKNIEKIKEKAEDIFYSDEYEEKKNSIYRHFQNNTEEIIKELNKKAKEYNFVFEKIEEGLVSVPIVDGKPLTDEEVELLPEDQIDIIKSNSNKLETETISIIKKFRKIEEELEEKIISIESEIVVGLTDKYLDSVLDMFRYNKNVTKYIEDIKEDIKDNIEEFITDSDEEMEIKKLLSKNNIANDFFYRYKVNLFIDNSELKGAPVITEVDPTYYNLFGKIEYYNEMGYLKTDHTRIKAGAIHKANGGFLLLKAKELLSNFKSWKGLKNCLLTGESRVENISKENIIEENITPEPIPLDIKIILIGDEYTYQLLYNYDEDFKKLFKIKVDFDVEMERNDKNIEKIISFIKTHSEKENIRPFTKGAVGEIIEYSSRCVENQRKLTTKFGDILELMYEGDAWANLLESKIIKSYHIKKAIDEKIYRNNKYEEKLKEMIYSGKLMIDTEGEKIGEINGLAVIDMGEYSFGKPTKITASTYMGRDGIINIEREVGNSGDIHDKGVFILSGFIGEEFGKSNPISLSASITFEQNYGRIDGDSASSTELYSLLSSLADIPINQGIATTGSINQKGMIQAIGGVNEKIEGFFKVCKSKGLTGEEGVIIPHQNIENLMISGEVIEAVNKGLFSIYGVKNIKEGIEILTGLPFGDRDKKGKFKAGTIGYLVDRKLKDYSKIYD